MKWCSGFSLGKGQHASAYPFLFIRDHSNLSFHSTTLAHASPQLMKAHRPDASSNSELGFEVRLSLLRMFFFKIFWVKLVKRSHCSVCCWSYLYLLWEQLEQNPFLFFIMALKLYFSGDAN